jgi:hypothetical protein
VVYTYQKRRGQWEGGPYRVREGRVCKIIGGFFFLMFLSKPGLLEKAGLDHSSIALMDKARQLKEMPFGMFKSDD